MGNKFVSVAGVNPPSDIRSARMRRDSDRNYVGKSRPESRAKTRERVLNGELLFNMLVLVGAVKMSDRIIREMMGL